MSSSLRLRVRLLLAVLLALGLAGALSPASQAATAEDEPAPSIQIVIDQLVPLLPGPNSILRIKGRVISRTRATLSDVSIQLRRSADPLTARKDVSTTASADVSPPDGDPDGLAVYGTRQVVASSLSPDSRQSFTLKVPMSQLGLTQPGTYVLGLEAIGRDPDVDEFDARKGALRTFLPWFPPGSDVTPIDLVWLWPLAGWPARTPDGTLLNGRTPAELSPGGRLDRLLTTGSRYRTTVSWIADPALLQTASDMTRGYQVMQDGAVVIGTREEQAARWLARLSSATSIVGMRALPYADIDASAVTRADMSNDVVRAVTQGPGIATAALGARVPGNLYWAPFGRIDRATANVLAAAGVTAIVLSSDAMPATDEAETTEGMATAALPTSAGSIRAVLTDPGLADILAMPQRSASDVILARQQFLAETALLATSLAPDAVSRTVVVAPDSVRWDPTASLLAPLLKATRKAPWLAHESLENLLSAPPSSAGRQRGGYGDKAKAAELTPSYMADVASITARLDSFTSIIDDPTGISEPYSAALLRAESSAWRSSPTTGHELLADISADLGVEMSRVRVLSEGTITFSGDTGRVPVTITNDLDRSVTVGLALRGRPPLRLSSEPLSNIRIEPGRMTSVDIDARVVGGEPLNVQIQLLRPDGEDYGSPAAITLSSTAYARAAAWVVALAFLAILVFVLVGVTRRIRKAQSARTPSDLAP